MKRQKKSNENPNVVYFNSRENKILSNFWGIRMEFNIKNAYKQTEIYKSVEHFYQAMKTTDPKQRAEIRRQSSPSEARRVGSNPRKTTLRPDWKALRMEVMEFALRKRAMVDFTFRNFLVSTGTKTLIHRAPWDGFWGDGPDGKGENQLGIMLMELRYELTHPKSEPIG